MTCVTVSSIVFAEAPGYAAVTLIAGGTMLGYCAMGSRTIESAPATMMRMAMTHANTGRSMKNLDIGNCVSGCPVQRALNAVAGIGAAGTAFTGAPGRMRWRLSTIT